MIECSGRVLVGAEERVTGRLRWSGDIVTDRSDTAKILLWDGISDITEMLNETAVGIVIVGVDDREVKLPDGMLCRLPVFMLSEYQNEVEHILSDKIAILDCHRQKLCVDPDIEVIKSYFGRLSALPESKTPWLCTDSHTVVDGCDGIVVRVDGDEEEVYDFLCDIADRNTGARIVAQTEYDIGTLDRIRGVLRAAVWGRISLLCRANTPDEIEHFFSMTHTAFCSLESEGREFNGFIPKGIRVDTPIMLLSPPNRFSDIFVMDCNALLRRFTASEEIGCAAKEVFSYISRFIRQAGDVKTVLCVNGNIAPYAVGYFKDTRQLDEIYTDKTTARILDKWL